MIEPAQATLAPILNMVLTLAVEDNPGRGENPSDGGGIAIILGVIVGVIVVLALAGFLIAKLTSRRRGQAPGDGG